MNPVKGRIANFTGGDKSYWIEVSQEEQRCRFLARIHDGHKIWKLNPMDLESHRRWYDYSRARDEMLAATDTKVAPWYIVMPTTSGAPSLTASIF